MNYLKASLAALIACVAVVCNAKQPITPNLIAKANQQEMSNWVETTLNSMTLEERIGQIIVMTIDPNLNEQNKAIIDMWIDTCHIGGLLFSGGYIEKQAEVTNYAQSRTKIPLMVTIDGEWGLGMRLKDSPSFPRALTLGAIQDESLVYKMGAEIARECHRMGIHVNFAPDADIQEDPILEGHSKRSYGQSAHNVARKVVAFAKGMEDNGIVATAKHFPGHGSTKDDSHLMLPVINKTFEQVDNYELVPFKQYIDAGLSGIMVAHLVFPAIDSDTVPSSLSNKYVDGLLKSDLGFNGLAFTDALEMKGANSDGSVCVKGILAGDNVLLCPANPKGEIAAVVQAVKEGIISRETIDERARQMLRYKFALGITTPQHINIDNIVSEVYTSAADELISELYRNAITACPSRHKTLPLATSKRVAVVTIGAKGKGDAVFLNTCAELSNIDNYTFTPGDDINALTSNLNAMKYDAIILAIYTGQNLRVICDNITSRCKHVVPVFFTDYYDIHKYNYTLNNCDEVVVAFSNEKPAQVEAARIIFGLNEAKGQLPMSIPSFFKLDSTK